MTKVELRSIELPSVKKLDERFNESSTDKVDFLSSFVFLFIKLGRKHGAPSG